MRKRFGSCQVAKLPGARSQLAEQSGVGEFMLRTNSETHCGMGIAPVPFYAGTDGTPINASMTAHANSTESRGLKLPADEMNWFLAAIRTGRRS